MYRVLSLFPRPTPPLSSDAVWTTDPPKLVGEVGVPPPKTTIVCPASTTVPYGNVCLEAKLGSALSVM